jgi:hypothetical protein
MHDPSFELHAVEGPAAAHLRRAGDFALGGHRLHSANRQADQRLRIFDGDSFAHRNVYRTVVPVKSTHWPQRAHD